MSIKKKLICLALTITTITSAMLAGGAIIKRGDPVKMANLENVKDLCIKTPIGEIPMHLPIKNGEPIGVYIEGFNEEERKEIISAIKQLDDISKNINYIILDEDVNMRQKLYIKCKPLENKLGLAGFFCAPIYATITYPLKIYVVPGLEKIKGTEGSTLLSGVIKHELLHTLGFDDLYNGREAEKSIMYYSPNLEDYSPRDIAVIKHVYDNEPLPDNFNDDDFEYFK